jgi:hypothetical protein
MFIKDREMPLSGYYEISVYSLSEGSAPERAYVHCLRPKAEFAHMSDRALEWSEISCKKREGISLYLCITELEMLPISFW